MIALGQEYTARYGKEHLSITKCRLSLFKYPPGIPNGKFIQPPQCMPDEYKDSNSIIGYRKYYAMDKAQNDWFCYNKNRPEPLFIKEILNDQNN